MKKKVFHFGIFPAVVVLVILPVTLLAKLPYTKRAITKIDHLLRHAGIRFRQWAGIEDTDDWKILKAKNDKD